MIVDCESCHTRFRLDEARVPAAGAKVRCSRCKTAFIVHRPGATRQEAIDEVVAEATDPGSPSAPEATSDLLEMSTRISLTTQVSAESGDLAGASSEQWEFDEDPRPSYTARAEAPTITPISPAPRPAEESAAAPARPEEELEPLGSPEDWDLLGGAARRIAEEASFRADPEPARPSHPIARVEPEPRPEASVDAALSAAASFSPEPELATSAWQESLRRTLARTVEGAGWIAASALCVVGIALAFTPLPLPTDALAGRAAVAVEGSTQKLSRHTIESAVAGSLTVVRGQLPVGAATGRPERLRATWVDSNGVSLSGATAIAGPPTAIRKLREQSLARLQADHAAHALELTAGGPFEAVFGALPAGATRIALTREPAPAASPVVAPGEADGSAATTSSRPSALPSSE